MANLAYWPQSFLDELEGAARSGTPTLWALGGPSFVYATEQTTIWIDPYFAGTPDDALPGMYRAIAIPLDASQIRRADAVISTHDHLEHCHEATVMPIVRNTHAICIAPRSSARLMRNWGVPHKRLREVSAGDAIRVGDVAISVHPSHDPHEPDAVTYVLEASGVTLFVSGDTWNGSTLAEIGAIRQLDFALLAFGRTYYMTGEELIQAADNLAPGTLLPFHWEFWRSLTGDIAHLFDVYHQHRPSYAIKLLLMGDSLVLEASPRQQ